MELEDKLERIDSMFNELGKLMMDDRIIYHIGDKKYGEFINSVSPYICADINKKCTTVFGHNTEIVRYYCDKFNGCDE